MNTCDTCRHWVGPERYTPYGPEYPMIRIMGECQNPKVTGKTTEFLNTPDGEYRPYGDLMLCGDADPDFIEKGNHMEWFSFHTFPLDEATPDCSDTHGLGFMTGPKFSCCHWEPKELQV